MPTPLDIRVALLAQGYSPLPCKGKAPSIAEWQTKYAPTEEEIRAWPGGNTGVLTGNTVVLDIDVLDPDAAQYVEELVREMFGEAGTVLVRFGNPPKRAIPLRADTPFAKIVYRFKDSFGNKHKIEVLASGQQVIVAGRHPDTKQDYKWHGTDLWNVPHDDLPDTNEQELAEFLDTVAELLEEHFGFTRVTEAGNGPNGAAAPHEPVDIDGELAAIAPGNIHATQLRATSSLLRAGTSVEETVTEVLAATERVGEPTWNWKAENRKIERLCFDFVTKNPELSGTLPDALRGAFDALVAEGGEPKFRCGRDGAWSLNYTPPPNEAEAPKQPQKKSRLRFTAFDDAEVTDEPEFLIEGILPREGIGVLYAPPKCHKTFAAFDMAMHIALGRPYRGREVRYGPVVYNVFEGPRGFLKRAVAYRRHHLKNHVERVPLLVQSSRLNFAKDVAELVAGIEAEGITPVLVILDTLNRSLIGSESKDADMAGYLAAADKLREAFYCLVLIVHHCGLEQGRPRGHTSLTGAADVQISIKRVSDTSVLTVEYLKDGEDGTQLYSKLEVVDVGHGKTSCVIVEAEPPVDERPLSERAETMLAILREHGPLFLADWNKKGRAAGVGTERRGDLRDARAELQSKGKVTQMSDCIWAAKD
jgi:hypothetical protein